MKRMKLNALKRQLGQGMSEYIIITALIALAAIGVVGAFGGVVQQQIAAMATELAGGDAQAVQAPTVTADTTTTLDTWSEN